MSLWEKLMVNYCILEAWFPHQLENMQKLGKWQNIFPNQWILNTLESQGFWTKY